MSQPTEPRTTRPTDQRPTLSRRHALGGVAGGLLLPATRFLEARLQRGEMRNHCIYIGDRVFRCLALRRRHGVELS